MTETVALISLEGKVSYSLMTYQTYVISLEIDLFFKYFNGITLSKIGL